ncbi:MAG: triose-phosphate isomerase [Candidatus Niyogibacteria bacterium]|nr:triose-phosphate isomerase [Candidatus Niyogibacteria bacterium]
MKRIFIANWKMNPANIAAARKLFSGITAHTAGAKNARILVAPPFLFLSALPKSRRIVLGVQNIFYEKAGAYTGEISADMAFAAGARFAIIGHSERRALGETDAAINLKIKAALASGLQAVLCVGERDRTDENFQHTVRAQLMADLETVQKKSAGRLVVAYEPVWAIGTGKTVEPRDLFEMATYIRRIMLELFGKALALRIPVLYGGSVNAANAPDFLRVAGVGGLLVGGASLDAQEFGAIVKSEL